MTSCVAVVTGGASGIGAAIARRLAGDGFTVAILDRNREDAEAVAADISQSKRTRAIALETDITAAASVITAVETVVREFGRIDVLVNNAGYGIAKGIDDTTEHDWDALMATNVKGAFLCAQACVPFLRTTRGTIVNIGSVAGHVGLPNRVAYCTSKAAIHGLTKALAVDLASDGVRVNAVAPGTVMGPFYDKLRGPEETRETFHKRLASRQLMGRWGEPEEIASAVAFMAGSGASFATGSILVIDGGLSAQ